MACCLHEYGNLGKQEAGVCNVLPWVDLHPVHVGYHIMVGSNTAAKNRQHFDIHFPNFFPEISFQFFWIICLMDQWLLPSVMFWWWCEGWIFDNPLLTTLKNARCLMHHWYTRRQWVKIHLLFLPHPAGDWSPSFYWSWGSSLWTFLPHVFSQKCIRLPYWQLCMHAYVISKRNCNTYPSKHIYGIYVLARVSVPISLGNNLHRFKII